MGSWELVWGFDSGPKFSKHQWLAVGLAVAINFEILLELIILDIILSYNIYIN